MKPGLGNGKRLPQVPEEPSVDARSKCLRQWREGGHHSTKLDIVDAQDSAAPPSDITGNSGRELFQRCDAHRHDRLKQHRICLSRSFFERK